MPQTEMKPSSPNSTKAASSPDVINKAAAKMCHIVKRPDFDGYGFNLHSEKAKPGQFIGKVDANSPAEAAGLKEGDRIIEVNGVMIHNETHKQVVQRIKAISCEVRLLLIDVEGKGDGVMLNGGGQQNNNGQVMESSKTEQVMPGASENINSITMVSTKRPSQESQTQRMSTQSNNSNNNGLDVTDKAVSAASDQQQMHYMMNNNNNNNNVPPPPSATMAAPSSMKTMTMNNNINSASSNNHMPTLTTTTTTPNAGSNGFATEMAAASGNAGSGTIKAGSLQLPMTAAEMRAKLMMKKKYDPKNESVDLKKKYEIVQKL